MKSPTWREECAPIIANLISEARAQGIADFNKLRRYVRERKPAWWPSWGWQTKIWRDETTRQLQNKPLKKGHNAPASPNQVKLFD